MYVMVKFIYSEKATKFREISTLLLTTVHRVKSKVEISHNFVAFSEYMNFTRGPLLYSLPQIHSRYESVDVQLNSIYLGAKIEMKLI